MITLEGTSDAGGLRFALVVSRYNDFVTDRLQSAALEALTQAGADERAVAVIKVPGAFEIPSAARRAADTRQFDAIICLGCVIRGETPHFEYIASAVSRGLMDASAATGVPMIFGVLTTNSAEQAIARAGDSSTNKGWEAAMAAIEMATLFRRLDRRPDQGIPV